MRAAYNGKAEVTKVLLDAGASIEAKSNVS